MTTTSQSASQSTSTKVALVTGASRGAGKGIAKALAGLGYIVYISGRTTKDGDNALPGSVWSTVEEINQQGAGQAIGVICDHRDNQQVKALFEQIQQQQQRLNILVNNATFIHDDLIQPGGFWEKPLDMVDILDVGLKSAYVASYFAAPIMVAQQKGMVAQQKGMVAQQKGLIVNTSSFGARCYMHGPSYGAQKIGVDKMAWDMAHDLRPHQVAAISLWMGMLLTERTQRVMAAEPEKYVGFQELAESPEFQGLVIDALFNDTELMQKSGQTLISAELGADYGIRDIDGKTPVSHRAMLGDPVQWHAAVVA